MERRKRRKSVCYLTGISLLKVERCREKWALGTQHPLDVTDVPLKTRGHSNKPSGGKKVHHWWVNPVKFSFQAIKPTLNNVFFLSFCIKRKYHWPFPTYKICHTLLTLTVSSWSLPASSSSQWFDMGPSSTERARDKLFLCVFSSLSPFNPRFYSPPGAVWMAELANIIPISIFPDEGVILAQNPCWAGFHTVGTIYKMGTLHAIVRALQRETTCSQCPYISLFRRKFIR